jgi:GAF domain-containing protein
MEPIPETAAAANELDALEDPGGLLAHLTGLANEAKRIVPDLVGVSIGRHDEGLTFTLVAMVEEVAILDAIQYAAGGPCEAGAREQEVREFHHDDVLDEDAWRLFAAATAAHTILSTLTLPVTTDDRVVGTVNLYAASGRAFVGHHEQLADVFGAWAAGAVSNADLSFATREEARAAPDRIRDQVAIDTAVGILSVRLDVDVETAEARLRDAASRAGVGPADLARTILRAHEQDADGI